MLDLFNHLPDFTSFCTFCDGDGPTLGQTANMSHDIPRADPQTHPLFHRFHDITDALGSNNQFVGQLANGINDNEDVKGFCASGERSLVASYNDARQLKGVMMDFGEGGPQPAMRLTSTPYEHARFEDIHEVAESAGINGANSVELVFNKPQNVQSLQIHLNSPDEYCIRQIIGFS